MQAGTDFAKPRSTSHFGRPISRQLIFSGDRAPCPALILRQQERRGGNDVATASGIAIQHRESEAAPVAVPDSVQSDVSTDALRAMFAHSTERISIVDRQYRYRCVSPPVALAWSMTADDIIGLDISQLLGRHSFSAELKTYVDRALTGEAVCHAFWQTLPAGHILHEHRRFMEYQISPWKDAAGAIIGAVIRVQDRTAQRQAEEELAVTQQRLTDFASATSDWLWEMDSELRFVWISRELERFFNLDRRDMYGRQREATPANEEESQAWRAHNELLAKRKPFRDFEYRVNTNSGQRWARVSGVPVFDEQGVFTGYRGASSDITQIKTIEFQAQQAESRLIRAMDEYPGSFALFDEKQSLVVFNRQFAQFNASLGDQLAPGLHYAQCLKAQVDAGLYAEVDGVSIDDHDVWIEQQLEREPGPPVEVRCTNGDWMRLSRQPLPDGGCLETLVDITTEKSSELAINEERNLLRSLIDNIPDFIYAKDKQARFIVQNRAVSSFMRKVRQANGKPFKQKLEGTTDFDCYTTVMAQDFYAEDMRVINGGCGIRSKEELVENADSDNPFWVSTTKVPLRDTEGRIIGLVGTGRKISEQKAAQGELVHSQERFRDFAETAAELFWETSAELQVTWVSERYHEITGQLPQTILGRDYREVIVSRLVNEEDMDRLQQCLIRRTAFSELEILVGRESGDERHILLSGKPCYSGTGEFNGYRGTGRDVSKSRKLENLLSYQATHDELTGLPNRREFVRRLESKLSSENSAGTPSVLGYLDLDQFKVVNDSVGHLAGDQLLVQVAKLISSQLRGQDTVARLGGDEFGLLLDNCTPDQAIATMQRTIAAFEAFRFRWDDHVYGVGASIGLVAVAAEVDTSELLSRADVACFAAKDNGRGRVHLYRSGDSDSASHHRELLMAAGIRESISNNRFCLYAQPIAAYSDVATAELQIEHYEILLRLQAQDGSLVYPGAFIPAAERYGLMGNVDRWVIDNTLNQMQQHAANGAPSVTINLSGQSLSDDELADFVVCLLKKYQIEPARVCFEITETAVIRNLVQAQDFVRRMNAIGCKFALDDFGSGLSSFGYLKTFKVDFLKIDGSFVRDIVDDETDRLMVASINQIGKSLGIKTIAEFVENDAIAAELREIGVDLLQGYGIGKPVPFPQCFKMSAPALEK